METKKILIVVDCQNDFITGSLRNEEAIKVVPNIVRKINEFNGDRIFATQDTHFENYLDTKEGKWLPVTHCIKGTEGWDFEPSVKKALHDAEERTAVTYIGKFTFGSPDLAHLVSSLSRQGAEIEIVGFCTDICVVSNALLIKSAVYDKADISVDESCCAGVTPESHDAAIKTMNMCQIKII